MLMEAAGSVGNSAAFAVDNLEQRRGCYLRHLRLSGGMRGIAALQLCRVYGRKSAKNVATMGKEMRSCKRRAMRSTLKRRQMPIVGQDSK